MWGNDFRPSYSSLCTFKEHNIQIVAFTATATEDTAHRIINSLKLVNPNVLRFPLDRPNLAFKVVEKKETKSMVHVSELINNQFSGQCRIIYCFSTGDTLDMTYHLKQRGIKAVYYHGQLDVFILKRVRMLNVGWKADQMSCVLLMHLAWQLTKKCTLCYSSLYA